MVGRREDIKAWEEGKGEAGIFVVVRFGGFGC